ncbi:MAG TPA: GHKL domain-containing protein [Desulfobacterales bacterium]|nr:GHKL domain-containing protein [Desulfobacterales bacterium]
MEASDHSTQGPFSTLSSGTDRLLRIAQKRFEIGYFKKFCDTVCEHAKNLANCSFQIWNGSGSPITTRHKPHNICEWLQANVRVESRCRGDDGEAVLYALDHGKVKEYICWAGFTCFMQPILLNRVPIGVISVGEFLTEENPEIKEDCRNELRRMHIDRYEMERQFDRQVATLNSSQLESLKATTEVLSTVTADFLSDRLTEIKCDDYFNKLEARVSNILPIDEYGLLLTFKIIRSVYGALLRQLLDLSEYERGLRLHHAISPLQQILLVVQKIDDDADREYAEKLIKDCTERISDGLAPQHSPESIWFLSTEKEEIYLKQFTNTILQKLEREPSRLLTDDDLIENDIPLNLRILVPKAHIQWILENLLDNAIKASDPPRRIRIDAAETDKELWISIADNGCGMTQSELDNLWRERKPGQSFLRRRQAGAGMGLYLVRELAHRNWGDVVVNSNPKEGTTVQVTFTKMEG